MDTVVAVEQRERLEDSEAEPVSPMTSKKGTRGVRANITEIVVEQGLEEAEQDLSYCCQVRFRKEGIGGGRASITDTVVELGRD